MNRSPIKWAGGKFRVMLELLKHLPKAEHLIEPFVGSGTVFLNTDYRRYTLCDSNRALINFFRVLTNDTDRLIKYAAKKFSAGNNRDEYYATRKLFNNMQWSDTGKVDTALLYAVLFLYLNRHGFNGLFRINADGEFNVPFGSYKTPYLPSAEMRIFAEKARDTRTIFYCGDFRTSIPEFAQLGFDTVIYCDPPYIPASDTANFTTYGKPFTSDDHRDLVNALTAACNRHGHTAVISNSDTPETHAIYSSAFKLHPFSVRRSISAKSRDMAGEVIGTLLVCDGCGMTGGGNCPGCGPVMGDATFGAVGDNANAD